VRESNHNDYNVSVVKKEKSETKRAGSVRVRERERGSETLYLKYAIILCFKKHKEWLKGRMKIA
jgi:hypothetical protein